MFKIKQLLTQNSFTGISESEKTGLVGNFFFAQNLNIFQDPAKVTLNPQTIKDSGTTVTNLVKWAASGTPYDTNKYFYDLSGNLYKRTSAGAWSLIEAVPASDGQGLEMFNDYIYYTQRTQVGRYGPLDGAPAFTDNWKTGLNDTTSTKFAPIKAFANGMAVGHGNNVGWWDGSVFTATQLALPIGFNVRGLDITDEMLMITAWKGPSITSSEEAGLFFWDGSTTTTTYTYMIPIAEGPINALVNSKNRAWAIVGSSGKIFTDLKNMQNEEDHQIPKLAEANYVEVFPGAITNWRNRVCFGVSGNSDSTDIVQGVYQWGSKSNKWSAGLNMGFTISEGVTTGISIGMTKAFGNEMYIGWKHGSTYGVDRVLQTNNPFASGSLEFLIFDGQAPMLEKLADIMKASHLALKTGESITLGYKNDRAASYTTGGDSVVGDVNTKLPIKSADARFHEFQMEVVFGAGTTSPTLTGISLKYDDLLIEASSGKSNKPK